MGARAQVFQTSGRLAHPSRIRSSLQMELCTRKREASAHKFTPSIVDNVLAALLFLLCVTRVALLLRVLSAQSVLH